MSIVLLVLFLLIIYDNFTLVYTVQVTVDGTAGGTRNSGGNDTITLDSTYTKPLSKFERTSP